MPWLYVRVPVTACATCYKTYAWLLHVHVHDVWQVVQVLRQSAAAAVVFFQAS